MGDIPRDGLHRYHDLEDSYPGADGGGTIRGPRQSLVVGRIELSRHMTLKGDAPVPGSRLGLVEGRVAALEKWPVRIESMRNWIEAVDRRVARLEEDLQALVKALDRHFTPRKKKRRKA